MTSKQPMGSPTEEKLTNYEENRWNNWKHCFVTCTWANISVGLTRET